MGDAVGGLGGGNGHATWTSTMSTFMLKHLANVVAGGAKTSKGFKKVYLNACARAVNEKFSTRLTGEQIKNHLKTWSRKWSKITRLKKVSASGFDEDNHIITLDAEHYNTYIQDHKADADFLNTPLENYAEMETIFGNNMATGKFAKDSSAALGTKEDGETEEGNVYGDGLSNPCEEGATTKGGKAKKAKIVENEEEGLIGAFNVVGDKLAMAITQVASAKPENELLEDLFESVNSLGVSGFDCLQISMYYAHLVANPLIAKAFYCLPFEHKLNWMAMFVSQKFPGH